MAGSYDGRCPHLGGVMGRQVLRYASRCCYADSSPSSLLTILTHVREATLAHVGETTSSAQTAAATWQHNTATTQHATN